MKLVKCNEKKLKKLINEGKHFVCFGAGKFLQNLCDVTGLEKNIEWISDNNLNLWNKKYKLNGRNIIVKSPNAVKRIDNNLILLVTTTYHGQVVEQLSELKNWQNVTKVYYFPSEQDKNYNTFSWLLKKLKPQKKVIFRSGLEKYVPGFDFSDNAKALYDYMIENNYNDTYKMIWYVHEPSQFPELHSIKNVTAVSYEWENSKNLLKAFKYFYHLCTAKYIFFTDTHFWLRYCNKEQVRVNLWHGCGFKDRKTKNGPCGLNYDYMTVISPLYAKIHAEEFGCDIKQMLTTGLAKQDLLFKEPKQDLSEILGIAKAKKYIFWLPTFRMATEGLERLNEYVLDSDTGLPIITTIEKTKRINELLEKNDEYLIIKLHPVQRNSMISHMEFSRIKVIENETISNLGMQINTLLSKADALISDYSSVAVDFMVLDRPLAFMLEDEKQYKESRGFVFKNIHDYLPGKELYTLEDVEVFINEIADDLDTTKEKRQKLIKEMHSHQDGDNCKRILSAIGLEK